MAQVQDAYTVLLREKKLPMSLLEDPEKVARAGGKAARSHLLATQVHSCHGGNTDHAFQPDLSLVAGFGMRMVPMSAASVCTDWIQEQWTIFLCRAAL